MVLQQAVLPEKERKHRQQEAARRRKAERYSLRLKIRSFRQLRDQILQPMETVREIKRKRLL